MAAAMYTAIANAEIAQPPGYRERELALTIRQAGYDCPQVESIDVANIQEPGWESFRPEVALCNNGKRFLVAKSGRGGGNARPVVRQLPIEKRL
jgi:hypothetical protein